MAVRGQFQVIESLPVAADMTGHKYKAVFVSSGAVDVPAAAQGDGYDVIGVIQNEPTVAGRVAEVVMVGYTKMIAGEAIAIGDNLIAAGSDTDASAGRALVATRNGTIEASEAIIGRALSAAASAGDYFEAFVFCAPTGAANRTG